MIVKKIKVGVKVAKYFGTDGIRGIYGEKLSYELSYRTGIALGTFFGIGSYVIGRDTRVSGEEIEQALVKGLNDVGCDAVLVGIIPTPAVAFHAIRTEARCGIMISASHNPPEYNGIKVFDGFGVKLNEEQEGSCEYYIDNAPPLSAVRGKSIVMDDARELYISYVCNCVGSRLDGLKVWCDCGYGAASTVAFEAFNRLGTDVVIENFKLRGEKINCGCGALYPYYVRNSIKGTDHRIGFAFDGDADRLSVVFDGEILDGDTVLYNISKNMTLKENVVVGTILSNLALEQKLMSAGKRLIRTPVGDKFICDIMFRNHYNLGGEQSGHYIVYPHATTGDGLLAAMFFCKALYVGGKINPPEMLELCPQKSIAEFASPSIMYNEGFVALIDKHTEAMRGKGRLIVRMSGTEPKVRVMAECADMAVVDAVLKEFKQYIHNLK